MIRPFEGDELVSLNLLRAEDSPAGWLKFTNKYGMLKPLRELDHWYLLGRDKRLFMYQLEAEGEWHHLRKTLFKIYSFYPAIQRRDSRWLAHFIKWQDDD